MEISVVVPVFNRPQLIRGALASVLAQTYRDFEVVVVDDGSTDETPEVLARFAREAREAAGDTRDAPGLPPMRILRIPHSGKPGAVRNRGAEEAEGRLLAFLDSDDRWMPTKLEAQVRLHEGAAGGVTLPRAERPVPGARSSHTRERWIRRGREVSQKGQRHRRSGDLFDDSLRKCVIGPSTVMLERSLFEELGGFREDLEIAEDYELWLRLTHRVGVAYLDEGLTIKQAGDWPQLSERYGQIEVFRIQGLKRLVDGNYFADIPEHQAAAKTELARKCRIYAAGCRKRGREAEAEEYEAMAP